MVNRFNTMLSHYKFKQRLFHTADINNCNVVIMGEAYTSKTCTKCLHENSPGRNIFKCKSCNLIIDRDRQGSRNLYLKATST